MGSTLIKVLSKDDSLDVFGTIRSDSQHQFLTKINPNKLLSISDVSDESKLLDIFYAVRPDAVINCIGVTKHRDNGVSPLSKIKLNALLPHQLSQVCSLAGARFIHMSTDCVFSGRQGFYSEDDVPDSTDVYGRSKVLGEVTYGESLTIRTSIIGHELNTAYGLLNWFLSQEKKCKGFKSAIFSGLPAVVLAEVIRDYVLNNSNLRGLYHVAAEPINKYDLLKLIASVYQKKIEIQIDESLVINRSLNPSKFFEVSGFKAPNWRSLIQIMHDYK